VAKNNDICITSAMFLSTGLSKYCSFWRITWTTGVSQYSTVIYLLCLFGPDQRFAWNSLSYIWELMFEWGYAIFFHYLFIFHTLKAPYPRWSELG
jgi:hypothetical protein